MIAQCTETMGSVEHSISGLVDFHEILTIGSTHKRYLTEILITPSDRVKRSDYHDIKYV